jgi:hypothetical protein
VLCTMELPPEVAAVRTGTSPAPPGATLKVKTVLQLVVLVVRRQADLLTHQVGAPVLVALPVPAAPAEPGAPPEVRCP